MLQSKQTEILKRSVGMSAGAEIRAWVNRQSANTVLGLTMCFIFLALIVVIAVVWECVRKCRSSLQAHHRNRESGQWQRLEDGSSVLYSSEGRPVTRLGPMASLIRHGDDGRSDITSGMAGIGVYQLTRTGETLDMRADAHSMSGKYAPYDPPPSMAAFKYPPPGPAPTPASQQSIGTAVTSSSEQTRVGSMQDDIKKNDSSPQLQQPAELNGRRVSNAASLMSTIPSIEHAHVVYPGHQVHSSVTESVVSAVSRSVPATSPSVATTTPAVWPLPPRPEAPTPPSAASAGDRAASHIRAASVGESAFSTPKTAATPSKVAAASPGHHRAGSFNARPLALSSSLSSSAVPALANPQSSSPPRVELRRNWSIGTWIPQLSRGGGADQEQTSSSGNGGVDEEGRARVVRSVTTGAAGV
ncbi:hypothetical protein JCM10908_000555 [Rhodotorula pacifica]|uniref:uncharacterized protein n=1 Tax=Rhodotorula pacifica TaxID=1495444 RepID=UPI00317F53A5